MQWGAQQPEKPANIKYAMDDCWRNSGKSDRMAERKDTIYQFLPESVSVHSHIPEGQKLSQDKGVSA